VVKKLKRPFPLRLRNEYLAAETLCCATRWAAACSSATASIACSRRLPGIIAQQPAETLTTDYLTHVSTDFQFGCNQLVIETLMIALFEISS
jgi:hypothetical protein